MCIKKILLTMSLLCFTSLTANAKNVWVNNLRSDFLNNSTIIYAVNMRTFNADDKNGDGIINFNEGETSGTFMNGISRLEELKNEGITALHLLPVTPVGKTKALGTAGSLYSASSFNSLNPQLNDYTSGISIEEQAKRFIEVAHNKGIAIIADLPGCGSYDLYLQRPELFVKDSSGEPVIPSDWTDVRLLNAGTETNINKDVFKLYQDFVDYMQKLGVDGIRADVAHNKPAKFWKELIEYSRKSDPQFLWLAESSDSWKTGVSDKGVFTPYDKLLEAGFDGYYGSYFNLKNWKTAKELENHVNFNLSLKKKFGENKSVIGSFTTHDELSPILEKGGMFSNMIMWLNATLPLNAYFVDGFSTGDNYIYFWANKKAPVTYTDDDIYFVHRGKIDIFNFSRKPGGNNNQLHTNFVMANQLKKFISEMNGNKTFNFLKTSSAETFAYIIQDSNHSVIVYGNLDFKNSKNIKFSIPKIKSEVSYSPIIMSNVPDIKNGILSVNLYAGEIQVLILNNFTEQ